MFQDRIKSVLWLWLFKGLQPCLAGRRSFIERQDCSQSSFSVGRLPLSVEGIACRWGKRRGKSERTYSDKSIHGLTVPAALKYDSDELFWDSMVRPVSVSTLRKKPAPPKQPQSSTALRSSVTRPIVPLDAWEKFTGLEFEEEEVVEELAQTALEMCTQPENPFIAWTAHKDTKKILKESESMEALQAGKVLVYVGKAKREGFGTQLPIFKTKAILPLPAKEMAELLMDSGRVKIYNKLSLGREDVRIFNQNTKVVRNLTKPPMSKSKMVTVTMMHSRPLQPEDHALLDEHKEGYLVVSRSAPGLLDPELAGLPRNDILLGANLLQDLGDGQCLMTAVSHMYSPVLPTMLARSMGVSSAVQFIKDIRQACVRAL